MNTKKNNLVINILAVEHSGAINFLADSTLQSTGDLLKY